jgi:WD40 repeat protein
MVRKITISFIILLSGFICIQPSEAQWINEDAIVSIKWNSQLNWLAVAKTTGEIQIIEVATGTLITTFTNNNPEFLYQVAWSHDGQQLALPDRNNVIIRRVSDWEITHQFNMSASPIGIAWNSQDTQIAAVSYWGYPYNFIGWDLATDEIFYQMDDENYSGTFYSINRNGNVFAATAGSSVGLWHIPEIIPEDILRGPIGEIITTAWSPNSQYLVGAGNGPVVIWEMSTGEVYRELVGHVITSGDELVFSVAWSPDGRYLASGGSDKTVRIWDVQEGEQVYQIEAGAEVYSVAWSPDGSQIAYGGEANTFSLTDTSVFLPTPTPTLTPTLTPSPTVTPSPTPIPCPSNSACFTVGNFRAVQYTGDPRVYIERSMAAGIDPFDSPPTDGWTLIGRTNGAGDNGVLRAFTVINNVPYAALQHPTKGCIVVTPRSLGPRTQGQTRLVNIIEQGNSARCNGDWSGLGG